VTRSVRRLRVPHCLYDIVLVRLPLSLLDHLRVCLRGASPFLLCSFSPNSHFTKSELFEFLASIFFPPRFCFLTLASSLLSRSFIGCPNAGSADAVSS
jgi:hypothetical protein